MSPSSGQFIDETLWWFGLEVGEGLLAAVEGRPEGGLLFWKGTLVAMRFCSLALTGDRGCLVFTLFLGDSSSAISIGCTVSLYSQF